MLMAEEGIAALELGDQAVDVGHAHVAAGQRPFAGPAFARFRTAKIGREPFQRLFGEPAVGRDLAAIDREQRHAAGCVELEHVVARRGLGFAGAVVIERSHAGIGPDHVS